MIARVFNHLAAAYFVVPGGLMKYSVLLCVALLGCGALDEPEVATVTSAYTGESEQGVNILGERPDALVDTTARRHIRFDIKPSDSGHSATATIGVSASTAGAYLIATDGGATFSRSDAWFNNLVLRGVGFSWQIRIQPNEAVTNADGTLTRYHLMRQRLLGGAPFGAWEEYCKDSTVKAIAIRGGYTTNRDHEDAPALSFACDEDGVGAKCASWGYFAGNQRTVGDDTDWDRNQACTKMANAWYCPNQGSHTRVGTPIQYGNYRRGGSPLPYDLPSYPLPPPLPGDPDAFSFEAGWGPNGPICLSKLRWQSLPPNPCNTSLPDPRTRDGRNLGGQFCDELDYATIYNRGARLINGSKVMDAPVHNWTSSTPGDTVASMRGYVSNSDPAFLEIVPPVLAVGTPPVTSSPYGPAVLPMDHLILRNLPTSLPAATMVTLNRYVNPATKDRVVLPAAPNGNYQLEDFEGYAFPTAGPGRAELRRCGLPPNLTTTIAATCPGGLGAGMPLGVFALLPP